MKNTLILYQSKYGATRKYAKWLSDHLDCDIAVTKSVRLADIEKYEIIIFGGGIYASGIAGISLIKNNYADLKQKKIIIFAVGASPYHLESIEALKKRNLKHEMIETPFFYCRGVWDESIMSVKDKILCYMLKRAVSKKDPSTYQFWEKALMAAINSNTTDWTNEKYLEPIIELVRTF